MPMPVRRAPCAVPFPRMATVADGAPTRACVPGWRLSATFHERFQNKAGVDAQHEPAIMALILMKCADARLDPPS